MPKYTKEELLQHANPYTLVEDVDTLIQSRDGLEELSYDEKNDLIFRMLCNKENFKPLRHVADALRHPTSQASTTFHALLTRAIEACCRLDAVIDKRNPNPAGDFVSEAFDTDLFNEFANLAQHRLAGKEKLFAQRLSSAAVFHHGQIAKNLSKLCQNPTGDVFRTIGEHFGKLREDKVKGALSQGKQEENHSVNNNNNHHPSCCTLF